MVALAVHLGCECMGNHRFALTDQLAVAGFGYPANNLTQETPLAIRLVPVPVAPALRFGRPMA